MNNEWKKIPNSLVRSVKVHFHSWVDLLKTDRFFWIGLILRVGLIFIWVLVGINGPDINDMNELLYEGILVTLQGQSPYGKNYTLTVLGDNILHPYFSYPPLAIIFHLPAVLLGPLQFQTIGNADFMPFFTLLHLVCDAIVYKALLDANSKKGALIMWIIPFWVFMDMMTFLSVPLMLSVIGFLKIEQPKQALLWFSLATFVYQYCGIFLIFFLIYKWRNLSKLLMSLIPVILISVAFFFLNPSGMITDLVIEQMNRGYESWIVNRYNSPFFFIGSIPAIIYNLFGIETGLYVNIMNSILILFMLLDIARYKGNRHGLFVFYSGISLLLVLMGSLHGNLHLYLLLVPLPLIANIFGKSLYSVPEGQPKSIFYPILKGFKKLLVKIQNISWFPSKETLIGLLLRTITIVAFLLFALNFPQFPDLNDQNQKVMMGLEFMLQGINPFGQTYNLSAVAALPRDWFVENFYHYGPGSLIFHLPTLLYPAYWSGVGFLDFMPSMFLLHMFCDYISYKALMKKGMKLAGMVIWVLPIFVFIDFVLFISVPIMFLILGITEIDNTLKSTLYLGLSAVTYHFIAPILVFVMIYHLVKNKDIKSIILGLIPTILILGFFQAWCILDGTPLLMIHDLFLSQTERVYISWGSKAIDFLAWSGSIPALAYNFSLLLGLPNEPLALLTSGEFRISDLMMLITILVSGINVIRFIKKPSYWRIFHFSGISLVLLAASTPHGLLHYWLFAIIPYLYYFEYKKNNIIENNELEKKTV
ncbi:MAG: hypothetical protein ACTSUV_06735 [Candidatus Ranarchaeia archaeon]